MGRFLMKNKFIFYGVALAVLLFLLQWIEYNVLQTGFVFNTYTGLLAVIFLLLGLWLGNSFFRKTIVKQDDLAENTKNANLAILTQREYEVLRLIEQGFSNKEIAGRLFVSENTVKTHLYRLFEKLEVKRRMQAVNKAKEIGIL